MHCLFLINFFITHIQVDLVCSLHQYKFHCLQSIVVSPLCSAASHSMCVRGRQDLEIQGPRLNMTKEEKTSVRHGSDRRLEPIITPPMPLLEVGEWVVVCVCLCCTAATVNPLQL